MRVAVVSMVDQRGAVRLVEWFDSAAEAHDAAAVSRVGFPGARVVVISGADDGAVMKAWPHYFVEGASNV